MDCSLPRSSVRGILQARILEGVAMPFSRGSSRPRNRTWVSSLQADSLPFEPPGKPVIYSPVWQLQSAPLTSTSPASSLGGVSPLQKFSSQCAVPKSNRVTLGVPLTQSAVYHCFGGCPGGSDSKESACKAGDPGSIPGLGGSPGEGNVYPLQYSGLENPKSQTRLNH